MARIAGLDPIVDQMLRQMTGDALTFERLRLVEVDVDVVVVPGGLATGKGQLRMPPKAEAVLEVWLDQDPADGGIGDQDFDQRRAPGIC